MGQTTELREAPNIGVGAASQRTERRNSRSVREFSGPAAARRDVLPSALRPVAIAQDLGDLDVIFRVPLLAAEALREAMALVLTPSAQRFFVLPPNDRQSLAVVGRVAAEADEAGHGLRGGEHLRRHVRIAWPGVRAQT